jgi:uncharacterized membrane protein affecting hemolysin expression
MFCFKLLQRELPMSDSQLVMQEEDHQKIMVIIQRLAKDASAKSIFIVDKNGQLIAEAGEMRGIDTTSIASLTAGNVAATSGIARLIGEDEFPTQFHQGASDNLYTAIIAGRIILIFEEMQKKTEAGSAIPGGSPFQEITDDDIDNLFSD